MQGLSAIVMADTKAAVRYRIVVALAGLLLISVVMLPLMIKHDGSAQGFTQILLTYTLSKVTFLLGFATLWLACGSLAHEIQESQMQLLSVKPIPRWRIWLGKWFGIILYQCILFSGVFSCRLWHH